MLIADKRLVELVGEGGCHLAHGAETGDVDQFGLQFLQTCLGLLLFGEIADETRKVRLPTRLHLADGEMHRKRGAVLAHAGHDAADADNASFTGLQVAGEVAVMAAAIRLRHQFADILSDRLGFGVAELARGGAGKELHDAMLVDHDHRIRDRIQDRAKVPLARPDGVLEAFFTVDIDHDPAEPRWDATSAVDDGAECAHPMTILGPGQPVLNVEIAAGVDRLLQGRRRAISILWIQQGEEKFVIDGRIGRDAEKRSGGVGPVQIPG